MNQSISPLGEYMTNTQNKIFSLLNTMVPILLYWNKLGDCHLMVSDKYYPNLLTWNYYEEQNQFIYGFYRDQLRRLINKITELTKTVKSVLKKKVRFISYIHHSSIYFTNKIRRNK